MISDLQAIDVHAHYGPYRREGSSLLNSFMSGDIETVIKRAQQANTRLSIVSPTLGLLPRHNSNPVAANEEAARDVANVEGLRQWVVVDPLKEQTYDQAARMLDLPKCVGIKIHPEEHGYSISERGKEIFEFAEKSNAIILTHSGEKKSMPEDFVQFANDFPQVTLILAHLGLGFDEDPSHQIRAVKAGKHNNIFVDTSSALSITSRLIEWAATEIGADRILYGTDSPLYFAPMHRARIDNAEISDEDKKKILFDNAVKLFGFEISEDYDE